MRTWGIVIVTCLGAAATPALAEEPKTFEALAGGARTLSRADLAGLTWALSAPCTDGDDLAQRQCKAVRDARAAVLRGETFVVDGDAAAFTVGEWKADSKSVPLVLRGCVACVEPIDGLYVVSAKAAPTWKSGTAQAAVVHETTRTFKDEAAAKKWAARATTLRTQLVVRLAAAAGGTWERDGKRGLAVDVLGYRVYDPCDGDVVCASPASGKAPTDRKACGEAVVEGAAPAAPADGEAPVAAPKEPKAPALPAQLTASDIKASMKPVIDAAKACFDTYGVAGNGKLSYIVAGDGSVLSYELTGDFVDTPTGKCIDKAARAATFPKVKKARFAFTYPLSLQ